MGKNGSERWISRNKFIKTNNYNPKKRAAEAKKAGIKPGTWIAGREEVERRIAATVAARPGLTLPPAPRLSAAGARVGPAAAEMLLPVPANN